VKKRQGPLRQSVNSQMDDFGERAKKKLATSSPVMGIQSASGGEGVKPKHIRRNAANPPKIAAPTVADILKRDFPHR
jgi:hypothetical protein